MKFRHPMVEWHIVQTNSVRKPQHCHHFGEALCDWRRQKPGYMKFRHPTVEGCILHTHLVRKPQPRHHFGEVLCARDRQKPGYMKFRHPMVEGCIVHTHLVRKPLPCHHFGEVLCDNSFLLDYWCKTAPMYTHLWVSIFGPLPSFGITSSSFL